ncbi:hypothetical protein D9M71_797430 [compost metagenome]
MIARSGLEVGQGLIDRIVTAFAGEVVIVGNPDTAAGDRRSATVLVALLDDQHAEPLIGKEHG